MRGRWGAFLTLLFALALLASVRCYCLESDTEKRVTDELAGAAHSAAQASGKDELAGVYTGKALTDMLEPQRILADVLSYAKAGIPSALGMLGALLAVVLLSALCRSVCHGVSAGALESGVELCSSSALVLAIAATQYSSISLVVEYFKNVSALMESMIPITGVVLAMGGNVSAASASVAGFYALLAVVERLCASTVAPVCCVMGIVAVCSSLYDGALLGGFCSAVKKIYNFLLSAVMTVLVFALGAQTSVASAADTVSARGAKLLSSTLIPVVGGAVGDTLRTVAGSVQYVKSVVGIGGIVFVAYVTLPALVSVLLSRLALLIAAGAAQMLGCGSACKLLDEMGNVYGCMLGVISISAISFCVALALFVRCAVAVG